MQIILIAVAALAIVLWVFNTTVRNLINAGIMNTLAWIVSHTPTIGGILVAILAIIAIPILLGVGWIGMWTSIGSWALSPMAGWIIAIGGIAMFIISLRWLIKPLMVISILTILFGACFPILKGALNEYGKDGEIQLANKVRGASLQMSPQGVLPAVVIEDAVLYDDNGKITTTKVILKTEVRTVDLEKKQFVGSAETFAHVMLPNLVGDFKDGSIGWIPVRKLHLGTNPPPPLTDDTSAKEKKVIEVSISGSEFPQSIELLPLGEYEINFHPVAAAAGATYCVILPNNGRETREIKNNLISVKGGEEAFAIWTAIPSVAKIRPK